MLRGKQLVAKPGLTRRYHVPPDAARIITALLTVRDKVIAPPLAGVRTPGGALTGGLEQDRPRLRNTLFHDLGSNIETATAT